MEFVNSIPQMKAYLEYDVDAHLQLFDCLSELKSDTDKDVQEAVELCEDQLMSVKKRNKDQEAYF